MLRTNRGRRRGRPFGCAPLFLAEFGVRLDAITLLSKTRGVRLFSDDAAADVHGSWTLQWVEDGRPRQRTIDLPVTASPQALGGVRRWWRCPMCHRRCRLLVATDPGALIACRLCIHARYISDYPARDRRRRFVVALVQALGAGSLDLDDVELDVLLAPRRRGVRRGRRILVRAARALGRLKRRCDGLPGIFDGGF